MGIETGITVLRGRARRGACEEGVSEERSQAKQTNTGNEWTLNLLRVQISTMIVKNATGITTIEKNSEQKKMSYTLKQQTPSVTT